MTLVDLLVSVDFDKVPYEKAAAKAINIGDLVGKVPTARVVDGDPYTAVRVRVDERRARQLEAAVATYCTVDTYADLDLY
jgi:hypothetical protein